jgi:hypothetical protein
VTKVKVAVDVAGFCPMGCGRTLFLGDGGHVTCSRIECSNPTAVTDLLHDAETEHVVEFTSTRFTIRHPLRERLNEGLDLWDCQLQQFLETLGGPPIMPGRYRARGSSRAWSWERLGGES